MLDALQASVAQEATFRIAVWRLRDSSKKQAATATLESSRAGVGASANDGALFDDAAFSLNALQSSNGLAVAITSVRGDARSGSSSNKDATRPSAASPSNTSSTTEHVAQVGSHWSCDDGLSAWAWLSQLQSVLTALTDLGTRPRKGVADSKVLQPLLDHVANWGGETARKRVAWILQLSEVLRLPDGPSKHEAACELYELLNHTVVPNGYDLLLVYTALQENARECRQAIEPAFVSFLGTRGCSELMKSLRELPAAQLANIPLTTTKNDGLISTLDELSVNEAISLVDVTMPGLPLIFVNEAWERLTGYKREYVLGLNPRLLQGSATEETAIAACVKAIRSHQSGTMCLSNYRRDGSRFRHNLSLHPISDQSGELRYMLGVSADSDAEPQVASMLDVVRRLIPKVCPVSERVLPLSLSRAVRIGKRGDFNVLRNTVAYFTSLICLDEPQRWFALVVRSPSVFNIYSAEYENLFKLPEDRNDYELSSLQLVRLASDIFRLKGDPSKRLVDRVWQTIQAKKARLRQLEALPEVISEASEDSFKKADISSQDGLSDDHNLTILPTPLTEDSLDRAVTPGRLRRQPYISLDEGYDSKEGTPDQQRRQVMADGVDGIDATARIVHERLKQVERLVAEDHWLEYLKMEMKIYTREQQYFIGDKTYSMRQTALEAMTLVLAPDYEEERELVSKHLWADYTVVEDAANFLFGLVHWGQHSVGAITVADVTVAGASHATCLLERAARKRTRFIVCVRGCSVRGCERDRLRAREAAGVRGCRRERLHACEAVCVQLICMAHLLSSQVHPSST